MIRIYDCSNSPERHPHRSTSFCPKENDIMYGLKQYAHMFNYKFVNNPKISDVIITNDVFPEAIKGLKIPKVKRMDGVFWQNHLKDNNIKLNESAMLADKIIFVSDFSKQSLYDLYNLRPENSITILNNVDTRIFKPLGIPKFEDNFTWAAAASNWEREEKRLNMIIEFAKIIESERLILIGHVPDKIAIPKNIRLVGYTENYNKLAMILNKCHAFVNLSFRDACPKCVVQARNCGLPILFAFSGGAQELIDFNRDYAIPENTKDGIGEIHFRDSSPVLNVKKIEECYGYFKGSRFGHKNNYIKPIPRYLETLKQYFDTITKTIMEY